MRVLLGPPGASTAGADEPGVVRMRYSRGQLQAEPAQHPEYDPQKLFTQAALQGLWAKLCDDADALDDYLPPHIAEMARKVAEALEVPVRSAVFVTASHLAICRLMTAARSGVTTSRQWQTTATSCPPAGTWLYWPAVTATLSLTRGRHIAPGHSDGWIRPGLSSLLSGRGTGRPLRSDA